MSDFSRNHNFSEQRPYSVDLPDGLQTTGVLRGPLSSDIPLCLMTHGDLGYGNGLVQYNTARTLSAAGIASLRLSVNGGPEDNLRNRFDVTQEVYAADVTAAADQLRNEGVGKLFGAGHSAGGLALLMASPKVEFDGLVLWDPSHGSSWGSHEGLEDGEEIIGDLVVQRKGNAYVRSLRQIESQTNMGDTTQLAIGKRALLIISAGKDADTLISYSQQYIDAASEPKSHIILKDTGHDLAGGEAIAEIGNLTAAWIKQNI